MTRKAEESNGLYEFFDEHPDESGRQFFAKEHGVSRRGFFRGAGLAATSGILGMTIPHLANMPRGLVPAAFAAEDVLVGKEGLILLNDRPISAETPAHLLDDNVTPTSRHFIRNNGLPPEDMDAGGWTITVDGLVENPLTMSIEELRSNFEVVSMALTIECGGNGRAYFDPPATGNQWTVGAVACSEWTGVRLADILKMAVPKPEVVYTAHYGRDAHLSGKQGKQPISRGVPIAKAMTDNVLIAFEMNGGPMHEQNGLPLRLVVPGWPGSCSQKWLRRIQLRDKVHDGPKMTGTSYRVPRYPIAPGEEVPKEDYEIIERMPVKSIVTFPENNSDVGRVFEFRGHAWSGDRSVAAVDLSIDFGATWVDAELDEPVNSGAWQNWRRTIEFPEAGYFEVWARATDSSGEMQPFAINWTSERLSEQFYAQSRASGRLRRVKG